jgi:hypothetical protein
MIMSGFDFSGIDYPQDRRADFERISEAIDRLAARRKTTIVVDGPFARSKLAWKIATYQQAILYRVVALGAGTRDAWNARNVLVMFLTTRALVETIAVFDDFERSLLAHVASEDLGAMDALAQNRTFATRDEELLDGHPEILATGVMTFIDKIEKRHDLPIRGNYEVMSERCHPNSAGHHQLYSQTDYIDGTVTFSEIKDLPRVLDHIRAPLGLLSLFERSMNELDPAVAKIAEIHHRLRPVR